MDGRRLPPHHGYLVCDHELLGKGVGQSLDLTERETVKMIMTRSMSRRKRRESNVDQDRLSDLPSEILLHIMSFMMIKDAVRTCILSKRWKDLWKFLPNFKLHVSEFSNPFKFFDFVSGIVSRRDGNHSLHTLDFHRHSSCRYQILKNLMTYAVNHRIQQLRIFVPSNLCLPPCVYSSWSLTSLHISVSMYDFKRRTRIPKSLDLPSLLCLHLVYVAISADKNGNAEPFSNCKKLHNLYLDHCVVLYPNALFSHNSENLNITNPKLVNLMMDYTYRLGHKTVISAPNLSCFTLNGAPFQTLRGQERENLNVEIQSSSLT
ncbi:putative F-box/FBD/LRR-repeat protein At4g13965 [Abrus precatorius]|uniref:F-box/FBD/LRR-repeat protein At4g13965 n=1 Tax=Abrus precatorius TaxID=3816 RepID=A0A8B8M7D0_ABRPR|nr:putative F-box/FBD/LRR-repeat protein At4g13965 [Abrus precatorius]